MDRILVIDDEEAICSSLQFALEDEYEVSTTTDPYEGIERVKRERFDLCLVDLKLGKISGIDVLTELITIQRDLLVIIMTAYSSIPSSVEAIKRGAYSYLTKPLHMEELYTLLKQALHFQQLNRQVEYLSKELEKQYGYREMIGKSPLMVNVFQLIDKVKDIDTNVLITGESGTGKELVARAIHFNGKRQDAHFEAVNCAAIPEHLLESELFGHAKGAFTGATTKREGKFVSANKGTIFLDEIGDMPPALQAKLLRVLQDKEVTPLGSDEKIRLDVRIIAATNRDLKQAVREGEFREDLYFRLNVVEIALPPLRNRMQDLPFLIHHFIQKFNAQLGKQIEGMTAEASDCLQRYSYPGNIRELSNIIESAMVIADGPYIKPQDLPEQVNHRSFLSSHSPESVEACINGLVGLPIKEVEEKLIVATLKSNNGHRKKTADMLGISERSLRDKLKNVRDLAK